MRDDSSKDASGKRPDSPGSGTRAPHDLGDDAARETAILHALGALPPEEARAFEAHAAVCDLCAEEARSHLEALAILGEAAGDAMSTRAMPPPSLRQRILEKVRSEEDSARTAEAETVQVWKSWGAIGESAGLSIRRAGEGHWEPTAARGVSVKPLHVDSARRYVTMLVRMEPGSAYPDHLHAGAEECYVLQGDLSVGDETLRAGDYQHAPAGSEHEIQSTREGCLLLIVSSQDDKLV